MTSQEEAILAQVDAQLNAMDDPSSAEVFYGLEEFSPRHQVAAAARVAKAGGGGGVRLLGPFHYDYTDFPVDGTELTVFTPNAGDVILRGSIDMATAVQWLDDSGVDFALGEDPDFDNASVPGTFWGFVPGGLGHAYDIPPNSDNGNAAIRLVGYTSTGAPMKIKATSLLNPTAGAMDLYFLVATPSLP